jgi:acetyl-CoA carboxylase carboxyltransferase component
VNEPAPRGPADDDPLRAEEALLTIVPRNRRQIYDAHKLLNMVVDRGSFFEIAPRYGRARITGLARIDGYPVGIMANSPRHYGGSTDVAAGSKVIRLIQLCDTFHLPLVSLADEPGFMVGPESEKLGIERAGARLVASVCMSHMHHHRYRQVVWRRRSMPSPALRHVPPFRVAVSHLGLHAHCRGRVRSLST